MFIFGGSFSTFTGTFCNHQMVWAATQKKVRHENWAAKRDRDAPSKDLVCQINISKRITVTRKNKRRLFKQMRKSSRKLSGEKRHRCSITVTELAHSCFNPLLWRPQDPHGCLKKQLSSNLVVWCATIQPKLNKVQKISEITIKHQKMSVFRRFFKVSEFWAQF